MYKVLISSFFSGHKMPVILAHTKVHWRAYSIPVDLSSVCGCVCYPFKHEYLRNQQAEFNQILSEASFGWGIDCIRFWTRYDWNSGFHGNK